MKMFLLPTNLGVLALPSSPKKESKATARQKRTKRNLVGGFKYLLFSHLFGEDSHFD